MPAIISFFVRQLIIIGVQLGIFGLIDKYITPLLNGAISAVVQTFGVSENAAQDILANEILTTAESLGLTVALSKARLPLAIADKLGFSTKGFAKRPVASDVEAKVAKARAGGGFGSVAPIIPTAAEAGSIIEAAKSSLPGFAKAYSLLLGTLGTVFLGFMVVGNWLDFGNWNNGAYQKTMQKFIAWVTFGKVVPDADYQKTKTLSPDVFTKVYETYKLNGAVGINDPFKRATVLFTRETLIDLLDQVGAKLVLVSGTASTKDVILASSLMIIFSAAADTPGSTAPAAVSTPAAGAVPSAPSAPSVKVFTGLLTSGTLGSQPAFVPRDNGIIESAQELAQDAQQEAASFLAALPGAIVYEVRIVNYVIAADGTRRSGTVQRIQTGTLKNGTPKYRVLRNKFAVLDLYYNDAAPGRTKIASLNIGPVDVAAFNPTPNDLASLVGTMQGQVVTSNIADISHVVTAQPITSAPPVAPLAVAPVVAPAPAPVAVPLYVSVIDSIGNIKSFGPYTTQSDAEAARLEYMRVHPEAANSKISTQLLGQSVSAPTPVVNTSSFTPAQQAAYAAATALIPSAPSAPVQSYDFTLTRIASGYVYNLPNGSGGTYSGPLEGAPAMPMGKLYEAKGLGPASTYTGNSTQIARLDQLI